MVVSDSGKTKGKDKERKASLSQGELGLGPGLLWVVLTGALAGHVQSPAAHPALRPPGGAQAGRGPETMAMSPSPSGADGQSSRGVPGAPPHFL